MNQEEIEKAFEEVLKVEGISRKLTFSRSKIYDWRNGRVKPSFGDKIDVLYQLGLIEIIKR